MNLTGQIKQIDLLALATEAGIELHRAGSAYRGLCPMHSERNPSFYVYGNRWHCYGGCGGGDAVDLIQGIYHCNISEALRRLGIDSGRITLKEKIEIKRRQRLKAQRLQRERDLLHTLSVLIRATRKCMENMTPEKFDRYCEIMDPLPTWNHYHNVLSTGTREEKDEVIEGLKDMGTISRNYLFRPDFNYRRWLFNLNHKWTKGVSHHNKGAGQDVKKRITRN